MLDTIDVKAFQAAKDSALTLETSIGAVTARILAVEDRPIAGFEAAKRAPFSVLLATETEMPPMDPTVTLTLPSGDVLEGLIMFRADQGECDAPCTTFQIHFC